MCGIIGIIKNKDAAPFDTRKFNAARDSLFHRGPDAGESFYNEHIAFGHRRLSIIDLSTHANQPMHSIDNKYTIIFNGEIYNYKILQQLLISNGVVFTTKSDTEVLLQMYIVFGESMLDKLEGMFAFAIWNNDTQSIFAARDRVGMKPLYYTFFNNQFLFASEPKAFFNYGIPLEIDENNLAELQIYRHVSGSNTLFKNVFQILPGYQFTINTQLHLKSKQWWNLKSKIQNHSPIQNPQEWFVHHFNDSIQKHMIADVPVGVLLSGGLDSSSVLASMYQQSFTNINTYTMGFKNYINDETNIAKQLTEKFGYSFNGMYLEDTNLAETTALANAIFDMPLMHQNEPHLIALSKVAKNKIKVLLSGEGADEFLGGYVRYKPLQYAKYFSLIKNGLQYLPNAFKNNRIKKAQAYFAQSSIKQLLLTNSVHLYEQEFENLHIKVNEVKIPYREQLVLEAQELYPKDYRRQMMYIDQHTYLYTLNDRNDRSTMAASVECRIPFLHPPLIEGLGTLHSEWFFTGAKSKYILKEAYKTTLSDDVIQFKKVGFSVPWMKLIQQTPYLYQQWLQMENSPMAKMGVYKYLNISALRKQVETSNNPRLLQYLLSVYFTICWYNIYTEKYA